MENVKEKILDELKTLRNRLIYEMSNVEFHVKVRGKNTYSTDDLFNIYMRMLHDIEALIDKL